MKKHRHAETTLRANAARKKPFEEEKTLE